MQPPSELVLAQFYRDFLKVTGINFNLYKQDQLQRRMLNLVDQRKLSSFDELTTIVLKDAEVRSWFLDKLAINVTEVFRNPELWEKLEQYIVQDLAPQKRSLKIWSAGCSTGAEAYSLAAVLDVVLPGKAHKIICTDIDDAAIAQAQSGVLIGTEFKHVPKKYQPYFEKTATGAVVAEKLKSYVSFHKHNLLGPPFGKDYDLIICRNVLIYFVEEAKGKIYEGFKEALLPGGYIFLGGSERIFETKELGLETPSPYFYRKTSEKKQWLNAS